MTLQFRLRELMARKARLTGQSVTYETISKEVGVLPKTLSKISQGKMKMIGLITIKKLCLALDCEPGELMVLVRGDFGEE